MRWQKKRITNKYDFVSYSREKIRHRNLSILVINILWGKQYVFPSNFVLDYFFGFGTRVRFINEKVYYSKKYTFIDECQFDKDDFEENFNLRTYHQINYVPTIHFGIKIGWAFK